MRRANRARFDLRFILRHAMRESRSEWRRLAPYMLAITLGVAALVAIQSFRDSVVESVRSEAQALLGGDLRMRWSGELADPAAAVIDSLIAAAVPVARVTETLSVALGPEQRTRLVQVRAVESAYPFYGVIVTQPGDLWPPSSDTRVVLVEPAVLVALDARVGDTLRIGRTGFVIAAVVLEPPFEMGFQNALAPRVFIASRWLEEAGLVQFGSLVEHSLYARIEAGGAELLDERYEDSFRAQHVSLRTAAEQADDLAEAFSVGARFLGLVGLAALLLGALGVGSAIHVFVQEKRSVIATLRCLGATRHTTFAAYLLQAAALGFLGATLGASLGIALQGVLPLLIGDAVPVDIGFELRWLRIVTGIVTGTSVALLFALHPMLEVRTVSPLQALRHIVDPHPVRRDPWRMATWAGVALAVTMLALIEAPTPMTGFGFVLGLAFALLLLRVAAFALLRFAGRVVSPRASFPVRQGLASLSRPGNQTVAVMLSLGFGVFLIATVLAVQAGLLDRLRVNDSAASPDLVAFDIQPDQADDVRRIFARHALPVPVLTPIVTARIAAINRVPVADLIDAARESGTVEPWTLRREYRNTYRPAWTAAEEIISGDAWESVRARGTLPRISVEADLANDMGVAIGDTITWDVQGVAIDTRIANLRTVDWTRLETNFFVVFEPGVLESAPQTLVALTRIGSSERAAELQRDLALAMPNVSTLELSLVQETLARIVAQVSRAIRFMGFFCVAAGILVLAGAIVASRAQRVRESVLLRTLGATGSQIRRILLAEYAALGLLAGLAGTALGGIAAALLLHFVFDVPVTPAARPLVPLWLATIILAVLAGAAGHRSILRRPPLAALRDIAAG
ncbi:MAG: ABC transporter permease [Longimicrobiales bacterium]